jgi:predicted glycogen debranching enzyme
MHSGHTGRVTLFRFGTQVCGSLIAGAQREWLVADGQGGYAMGTLSGLRTRRYHGLLVVAAGAPARRMLALASADPVVHLESGARIHLATHEWASGEVAPYGHELLESVEIRDGLPRWRWRAGAVVVERALAMQAGRPSLALTHTVLAGGPVTLTVEPLCTWRDAHGERIAAGGIEAELAGDGVIIERAYRIAGPGFEPGGEWYLGAHHREEAARGLNPDEDLFRPGRFAKRLETGDTLQVNAWAGDVATLASPPPPARDVIEAARRRHHELAAGAPDALTGTLALAADAFIVNTDAGPDVVAGYPWFGAWSRDTMISYEGLFVRTGRAEQGRELLRGYAATLSAGMLANTADTGTVEHNTADATLWFLHAVDRHVHATGDDDLAAELADALDSVVRHHLDGTRFGIGVDPADGLLSQGSDGWALTWMDAVVDGVPVTARQGKAVELNALWINGLAGLARIRRRTGRPFADLDRAHATATASFAKRFPSAHGWLNDVVDGPDGDDASLRPNQLFAFGLPYAPLRGGDPAPVRAAAGSLLTPLGLRSLAEQAPHYRGAHRGDPASRDRAYHQGTVWPWLIGAYADAAAAVGSDRAGLLGGIEAHLGEWGVGSVSESADGDPPHAATGCPFQAWSVAEALRVATDR